MTKPLLSASVALIAGLAMAGPATAQYTRAGSCTPLAVRNQIFGTMAGSCIRALTSQQLLIHDIDVIRRVTAVSFGMGPTSIEAAGLADLTPEEAVARLDEDLPGVTPAADIATTPAPKLFNAWVDGKNTYTDSTPAAFDLDGSLTNLLAGLDVKLGDRVTLGVMGSYETSHYEGIGFPPPDFSSEGWGAGPYFGVTLTPNIVWSGNFLYSSVKSDQNDFFHYESDRYQAATALTGYFYKGTWRFSPSLSLSWSKEQQTETAGFVSDETIETATVGPSLQIGNTLRLGDSATVEPWLGAAYDYTFLNRITDDMLGVILDDPTQDIRLQAGLNFGLGSNMQLAITGEMSGLLVDTADSYSAEANLAIQF
jgi:outer membrane autotransporter protein